MNKYFNEHSLGPYEYINPDMKLLCELTNEFVELIFMNPPVLQADMVHRPFHQEFKNNQQLIFSGCSETQGHYICEEDDSNKMYKNIWGFLLSNSLNLDSANLGIGGEGAYRIIQRLFAHFKQYGNPENLFCLFPDPYRLTVPKQDGFLIAKRPYAGKFLQSTHHNYPTVSKDVKYVKKPFFKEDVIAPAVPAFLNFQAISNLEQYCEQAGINFLWGSWHEDTNLIARIINTNNNYYKGFVDLSPSDYDVKDIFCHKNLYDESGRLYESGSDNWHLGTHGHAHIADKFVKEYKSRWLENE
jgi:hypothetical protein